MLKEGGVRGKGEALRFGKGQKVRKRARKMRLQVQDPSFFVAPH